MNVCRLYGNSPCDFSVNLKLSRRINSLKGHRKPGAITSPAAGDGFPLAAALGQD